MGLDAEIAIAGHGVENDADLRRLSYELVAAVGSEAFWLDAERDRHALSFLKHGYWDGVPDGAIEVSLISRYYGQSYERGHWPTLGAIIRFFRARMPTATIYYGSDASGPSLFTQAEEDDLWTHWAREADRPYLTYMSAMDEPFPNPLCTFCHEPMLRYGSGGDGRYGAFRCYCGADVTTRDKGETWTDREGKPLTITLCCAE